jgi:hypothetical protein
MAQFLKGWYGSCGVGFGMAHVLQDWYGSWSVSRFQEKEKRGEMITINDNIK